MSEPQPNFSRIFFDTFGVSSHPVRYGIRNDPNLLHDLAFLSSLTHDARVLSTEAQIINGTVSIALNRDCWELGYTDHENSKELHIADSVLKFTGAREIDWQFKKPPVDEPWVHYLWIDPGYRVEPEFDFFLIGSDGWKCTIRLAQDNWAIEIEDQEMPCLWSAQNSR